MSTKRNNHFFHCLKWFITKHYLLVLVVLLCTSINVIQQVNSISESGLGFPLDDAWIHQTYARSLAETGTWSYSLNEQSAGSTSPLWTMLLTPGFLIGTQFNIIWTITLSTLLLIGIAMTSVEILKKVLPNRARWWILAAVVVSSEWHLVWAAGSGMETVLFTWFVLLTFASVMNPKNGFWQAGLLVGLLIWIRPEGITLVGPVAFTLGVRLLERKVRVKELFLFLIILSALLGLYAWHNYSISGVVLPNTYFAKTQEYKALLDTPFYKRVFQMFVIAITGAGIILLPGFVSCVWRAGKSRDVWCIAAISWILGFILLYALRLPVTYQHGRYLIPVIPLYFILGIWGTNEFMQIIREKTRTLFELFAFGCLIFTNLAFSVKGVQIYRRDVNIIHELNVAPAIWLQENSNPLSIIAAHDIGAIGYYSKRRLVDLAGLINPEVIPFIQDESRLEEYIRDSRVDYLVVYTDWYKELGKKGNLIKRFSYQNGEKMKNVDIRGLK